MRVIAFDPGYERLGVAIIEKCGGEKDILLYSDCITTPKTIPFSERLLLLGKEVERLIGEFQPTHLALEQVYFNNNQKTAPAFLVYPTCYITQF